MSDFLSLEASGWKGRNGSAIASLEKDREFFLEIAREGFRRRRLLMRSLNLNGQPIARARSRCWPRQRRKIAYDESYSRFSRACCWNLRTCVACTRRGDLIGSIPAPCRTSSYD